jgi:hypothetical protein
MLHRSRAGGNGNLKSLKAIPDPKLQMKVIQKQQTMILESTEQRSLNTVVDRITETWEVPESKTVEGEPKLLRGSQKGNSSVRPRVGQVRFCVVEEGKRKHEDVRTAKL